MVRSFASAASLVASRATFFAFCVLLVIIWLPSYVLIQDLDLWQLIINSEQPTARMDHIRSARVTA